MMNDIRYRIESPSDTPCYVDKWYVIKETPCGYWVSCSKESELIKQQHEQYLTPMKHRTKWHGKNTRIPFTSATEKEAWEVFLKRRRIALGYAEARVDKCRGDIYEASEALGIESNLRKINRGLSLGLRYTR